jgi:hypothetical protein
MSGSEDIPLTQQVADSFIDLIRDDLTVAELGELRARNLAFKDSSECASREYLDADARMAVAFCVLVGHARVEASAADTEVWNTAWMLAKNAQFARSTTLTKNANSDPAYVYVIRGMAIEDPCTSNCGRFRVEPGRDYGLTADEVTALVEANARLHVESQSGTPTQLAFHVAPQRMTLSDVRERYPKLQPWHTGGGCMALLLECSGESYILITEPEDARIPDESATEVSVGWCAANADPLQEVDKISLDALPTWIDSVVQRAAHPQNVGDYFIVRLGEGHYDEALYELPLTSACGENCRNAIDTAVELIAHMRAAIGRDGAIIPGNQPGTREVLQTPEGTVVAIARRVIEAYWRG